MHLIGQQDGYASATRDEAEWRPHRAHRDPPCGAVGDGRGGNGRAQAPAANEQRSLTASKGERDNVALAGHRDTHFRKLRRRVERGDLIRMRTPDGVFNYRIEHDPHRTPRPRRPGPRHEASDADPRHVLSLPLDRPGAEALRRSREPHGAERVRRARSRWWRRAELARARAGADRCGSRLADHSSDPMGLAVLDHGIAGGSTERRPARPRTIRGTGVRGFSTVIS